MTEDREEQHKGFKVHDRRRFSESGEPRDADEASPAGERSEQPPREPGPGAASAAPGDTGHWPHDDHAEAAHHGAHGATEINFPTFVISLCTQALAHLGEIPDPATGSVAPDLVGARQLIDILAMLQEKTRGNLDADESSLLEQALYDLRIKFVERAQKR